MIFRRKIYDRFLAWKNDSKGTKALLIEGARRIGKSTIAEEFAKNEYKSYILIDFAKASEEIKEYFRLYLNDLDTFYMMLSVQYGVKLYPRESLII
ncbi:MAG TPA: AAA family ATPase, partial [Candidatus Avilachnospira avistercoris]|nr:AAA family ATPase [Candidatus Avilachnospira avistercoris]